MLKFQNRVQRYDFLRTQPNKMHKIRLVVHKPCVLCNKNPLSCSNLRGNRFGEALLLSGFLRGSLLGGSLLLRIGLLDEAALLVASRSRLLSGLLLSVGLLDEAAFLVASRSRLLRDSGSGRTGHENEDFRPYNAT